MNHTIATQNHIKLNYKENQMIMTDKELKSLYKQMLRDNYFRGFNKWFKSNEELLRLYRAERKKSRKNGQEFYVKEKIIKVHKAYFYERLKKRLK